MPKSQGHCRPFWLDRLDRIRKVGFARLNLALEPTLNRKTVDCDYVVMNTNANVTVFVFMTTYCEFKRGTKPPSKRPFRIASG
jgi:hypothetical protein